MEIKETVELEGDSGKKEIDTIIDTGAEISVIDEETLLKIGARHISNLEIATVGELVGPKPFYFVKFMKVRNCRIPAINVIGGKRNLLGRDVLERGRARIDEGAGKVEFPDWDGVLEI